MKDRMIDEENRKKYEILLLDDDRGFVEAIQLLLDAEGYVCSGYTEPEAALDRIRDAERPVRILIVDYLMVGITAQMVVEQVRAIDPRIYVILLTGYPQNMPGIYALRNLDIDGYCKKSADPTDLIVAVDTAIKAMQRTGTEGFTLGTGPFNERLKQLRIDHNLTQEELGEYLGVGRTTVVNYEQGRIRPTLENVVRLAKRFGVSCDDLLLDSFSEK